MLPVINILFLLPLVSFAQLATPGAVNADQCASLTLIPYPAPGCSGTPAYPRYTIRDQDEAVNMTS